MKGTPEQRLAKREADRLALARRNARIRVFAPVQDGTLALFSALRRAYGASTDVFLYQMLRYWQRGHRDAERDRARHNVTVRVTPRRGNRSLRHAEQIPL